MKYPLFAPAKHGGANQTGFDGVDFSVNTNPFGANPVLLFVAQAANLEAYPDPNYSNLKAALAGFHGCQPDSVILGVGASEILQRIARVWLEPNQHVVSVLPPFGEFSRAVALERCALTVCQPENALLTLEQLKPRLVYISNPNNPLGNCLERPLLLELANWCEQHHAHFILDQAYAPFAPQLLPIEYPSIIRVLSPGKAHGLVGLRLSYALAAPNTALHLENLAPAWILPSATAAALEALPNAQDYLTKTIPKLLGLSQQLSGQLAKICTVHFNGLPFFTLEVGDASQITQALLQRGIRVRDCTSYGYPSRIRISTQLEPANTKLLEALPEVLHG